MGYSEEQTRAYNSLMYDLEHFERMKKSLSKNKCPIHNKKLKMEGYWEEEYDLNIVISKYCCADFARQIAKHFIEAKTFTSVTIATQ